MGSFPPKDIDADPNMGAKFVRDLYEACDDTFGEAIRPHMLLAADLDAAYRIASGPDALLSHWHDGGSRLPPTRRAICIRCPAAGVGKYTVPVFWDKKTKTIVNNECALCPRTRFQTSCSHRRCPCVHGESTVCQQLRPWRGLDK